MFMFFIRSPLARFVSAFYSRQRQGRPRYFTPWQPGEHKAFETFKTPNELARALESDDAELRDAAEQAMNSIQHIRSSYWDWFENEAYLRSRAKDLFFMGQLDRLEEDFRRLKCKLGIPDHAALPSDDYTAHRTPESADRRLDDQAIATLKQWYKQDFEFIELCQELFDDEGRIGSAPSIESTLGRESEQRKG
ncbi:MAG: sulfotransferase family 2 domain-containing protein [Planctomycetota bacterium]